MFMEIQFFSVWDATCIQTSLQYIIPMLNPYMCTQPADLYLHSVIHQFPFLHRDYLEVADKSRKALHTSSVTLFHLVL